MEKTLQSKGRLAVNALHTMPKHEPVSILQTGRNIGYAFSTSLKRPFHCFRSAHHVRFNDYNQVRLFSLDNIPSITFDSGADGHYLNEADHQAAGLPILRQSSKQVAVANNQLSAAKHVS